MIHRYMSSYYTVVIFCDSNRGPHSSDIAPFSNFSAWITSWPPVVITVIGSSKSRWSWSSLFLELWYQRLVSVSKRREKAEPIWSIRSVVVVARPCWAKAWAAQALASRAAAHPAITPAPGSPGHSGCRVAQNRKTDSDPDSKSPWPPHLQ